MADKPVTREEKYLAYLTGDYTGELPKPITRKEKYLYELCLKGIGGEISPEEIKAAVNEYLEKNPVKPGATTEQAQQIEQNKTDIASLKTETGSLKEDISKIQNKFEFDIEMNIHAILNANPSDSTYIGYSDDENARCSDYIDCQNFKYISAKCNGSEWSWVIAFFNADKLFLPDISIIGIAGKSTYEVEIPESAKYTRISTYNTDISYFAKIMFSKKT